MRKKDDPNNGRKEMTPMQRAFLLGGTIVGGFATMAAMAYRESRKNNKGPKPPKR
jgi:hypothetical protein